MSITVWTLSADLDAKTATFKSNMTDAAKTARQAFGDIGNSAHGSGEKTKQSAGNVSAALGLVDNMIRGDHAAAMADMIREFEHTSVVMAAVPFAVTVASVAAVATIVVEAAHKVKEWREEQEKLRMATTQMGTAGNETFRSLDEKILEAEKRTDELNHNHLGALHKELELINMQSLDDLAQQFQLVSKSADDTFKRLEGHLYSLAGGSAGAKAELERFSTEYESLLAKGDKAGASNLLRSALAHNQSVLDQMKAAQSSGSYTTVAAGGSMSHEDMLKHEAAIAALRKSKTDYGERDVAAQEALMHVLTTQAGVEERIAKATKDNAANAALSTRKEIDTLRAEAARQSAEHLEKMGELSLGVEREQAQTSLAMHEGTIAERLALDIAFANREYVLQQETTQRLTAALDRGDGDYANKLKAFHDRVKEEKQAHENRLATLVSSAQVEQYHKQLTDLEANTRATISATQEGSLARLAVIDAAIFREQQQNLQNTSFYRDLLNQRFAATAKAAEDDAKLAEEAGKQAATHELAMGQLRLAAMREHFALEASVRHVSIALRLDQDMAAEEQEFQLQQQVLHREIAALSNAGKEKETKLKELHNKEQQLVRQHENSVTNLRERAEREREANILSAQRRAEQAMAQGLTSLITGQRTFAQMVEGYSQQAAGALVRLAIASLDANERTKMSDAGQAARDAFKSTMKAFPAPFNLIAAPIAGASAFTTMMGFNSGGIVPGIGATDVVPAMLTPGETVIPQRMTDLLMAAAQRTPGAGLVPDAVMNDLQGIARAAGGPNNQSPTIHVHVRPTYKIQALESAGMEKVLQQHTGVLEKHFAGVLRKMNR